MVAKYFKMYAENPAEKKIHDAVEVFRNDGLVIYPTDTVYGIGCNAFSKKGVEKLARLFNEKPNKMKLSFICVDLNNVSSYVKPLSNQIFKVFRKTLPGPYTYILEANSKLPKLLGANRHSLGFRVPDNKIILNLVSELGHPIVNASLKDADEVLEYTTDPEVIYENYKHKVDLVIDGGPGHNVPSTVVDCTGPHFEVIREGLGDTSIFFE